MGDIGMDSPGQPQIARSSRAAKATSYQMPGPTAPPSDLSELVFVDAYFVFYHTTYPFLHEATFRAQYIGQSSRPKGNTWPILLNAVLALGAWCIGDENSNMDDVFYNKVNRLSQDSSVFEVGNLALVQALLLLSSEYIWISDMLRPTLLYIMYPKHSLKQSYLLVLLQTPCFNWRMLTPWLSRLHTEAQ